MNTAAELLILEIWACVVVESLSKVVTVELEFVAPVTYFVEALSDAVIMLLASVSRCWLVWMM